MRRQISTRHLVSAIALAVVLILSIAYIYGGVLGMSLTRQSDTVTVELDQTGGLFEGSGVTYRGVRVGTVDSIRLDPDGVVVKAKLHTKRKIPADSTVAVRALSPAGEQFLDIQPHSSGPPYLKNGHLVGKADTMTPTSVAKALGSIDRLVGQIDEKDAATILGELSDAFKNPDDLAALLTNSESLLKTIDEAWPETLSTLENGKVVLQTGIDKQDEFAKFAGDSKELASWLRDYDPKARAILDDTPAQVEELRTLLSEFALKLPTFFDQSVQLTGVVAARDQHLRELLKNFPAGLMTLADTLYDGRFHVNMWVATGTVCDYGNEPKGLPKSTTRTPLDKSAKCRASFPEQQRGAAHAPPAAN